MTGQPTPEQALKDYCVNLNEMAEEGKIDTWEETLSQYKENIANGFKSVLIGVYRGKAAEGANFSDNDARMIICVGIPYPPFTDPYIKLKRDYYDNINPGLGEEWYTMQASRAISQAIGRGWRHKDDWCLGILLDNKLSWTSNNIKEKFSPWIKEKITYFHQWNKFQNMMKMVPHGIGT